MEKIFILLVATSFFCAITFAQKPRKCSIDGTIQGLSDGKKVTLSLQTGRFNTEARAEVFDSAVIKNGKFHFEGYVPEAPRFFFLNLGANGAHMDLFLDNDNVRIAIDLNNNHGGNVREDALVEGSRADRDWSMLKAWVFFESASDRVVLDSLNRLKRNLHSDGTLISIISGIRKKYLESLSIFLSAYRHNVAIPFLIYDINSGINKDSILIPIYNNLDERVKNSFYGKQLKEMLSFLPGKNAPDFSLRSLDGSDIQLKKVASQGKYTFVDFWASYCVPCRAENPNLKDQYNKFHNKGLNIISISLDTDKDKWSSAVKKDNTPWYNVSDLKGINGEVSKSYNCNSLPLNVLIDADGKIVGWNLYGVELNEMLQALFAM